MCILHHHHHHPSSIFIFHRHRFWFWQFITADTSQITMNINTNRPRKTLGAVDLASSQPKAPLCLSTLPAHTHTDTRCTIPTPTHYTTHRHTHTHTTHSTQNTGRQEQEAAQLSGPAATNKQTPAHDQCAVVIVWLQETVLYHYQFSSQLALSPKATTKNWELHTNLWSSVSTRSYAQLICA